MVQGDAQSAEMTLDNGMQAHITLIPIDGGLPLEISYLENMAKRYEELMTAIDKSLAKLKDTK